MKYEININEFQGPLDLLLHLIKQENISIQEISIDKITKQYLEYIEKMEEINLTIASEYLVMAAELIEIKSNSLLPVMKENEDDFEEDPKENLINRLLEYEQYKNLTNTFSKLASYRQEVHTREPDSLQKFQDNDKQIDYGIDLNDLVTVFTKLLEKKEQEKPLNTKITNKEYSVNRRCIEIKELLKNKKELNFVDLFDEFTKEYFVITFLSILSMCRNQELVIEQQNNFKNIIIKEKGV